MPNTCQTLAKNMNGQGLKLYNNKLLYNFKPSGFIFLKVNINRISLKCLNGYHKLCRGYESNNENETAMRTVDYKYANK